MVSSGPQSVQNYSERNFWSLILMIGVKLSSMLTWILPLPAKKVSFDPTYFFLNEANKFWL